MAKGISTRLSRRELRRFGIIIAIPLMLLALVGAWRHHTVLPALLGGAAAAIGGLALLVPGLLGPVHKFWMEGANALGWINTRILLSLVYFLVMTPLGVVMRLMGRDPMDRTLGDRPCYWTARNQGPDNRRSMELRF